MAIAVDEDIVSATVSGNISKLRSFISAGEDVNAHNTAAGYTLLHFATSVENNVNVEVVKFLLKQGADVNAHNIEDVGTPLHSATTRKVKKIF